MSVSCMIFPRLDICGRPIHPGMKHEYLLNDGGMISDGENKTEYSDLSLIQCLTFASKSQNTEKHNCESRVSR